MIYLFGDYIFQERLLEISRSEASKFLVSGKYSFAIPGALQALRFAAKVHGEDHVELVDSYLLLAEANLGQFHED